MTTTKKTSTKAAPKASKKTSTKAATKSPRAAKQKQPAETKAATRAPRWSLGVFHSARNGVELVAAYVNAVGAPAPYLAAKVREKKALFHAVYRGMSYAEAREKLMKDAAKAGVK